MRFIELVRSIKPDSGTMATEQQHAYDVKMPASVSIDQATDDQQPMAATPAASTTVVDPATAAAAAALLDLAANGPRRSGKEGAAK